MLQDRSREVDEFFNRVLTTQLFAPSNDSLGQTLITHNIQHGCEHAISSYRQYQEFCHDLFGVFSAFASLNSGRRLQDLYGHRGFREGIDLWVGAMAESKINGSNLDPIFACIMERRLLTYVMETGSSGRIQECLLRISKIPLATSDYLK